MLITCNQKTPTERYHLFTQAIIPRPIAWILTQNEQGQQNLAPFSYFNMICSEPALGVVSIGHKPDGSEKDTRDNLRKTGYGVVHIPHESDAALVTESAASLDGGESELAMLGLDTLPFGDFPLPRIACCSVALGCTVFEYRELGPAKQALITLEVKTVYLADSIVSNDQKGRLSVDAKAIAPLCRLGGGQYAKLGEVFSLIRPK